MYSADRLGALFQRGSGWRSVLFVVAVRPVGKGHRACFLQPCGDGRDLRRIRDKASGGENHIIIDIFTFQLRQASRPAGHTGLGAALQRNGDGRLLRHVDITAKAEAILSFLFRDCSKSILLQKGALGYLFSNRKLPEWQEIFRACYNAYTSLTLASR